MNNNASVRSLKIPPRSIEIDPIAPSKKRPKQEDCIKVYCRIRPIEGEDEPSSGSRTCYSGISIVEGQHTMVLLNEDSSRPISKKYTFTELFKDEKQEEVIRKLCDPLLQSIALEEGGTVNRGGLIFTYGVTNSGKTHTVLGTGEEPGILQYLFQQLPKPFTLLPVEVYNDEFFPLVAPRSKIHLLECSGIMQFKDYDPIQITNDNIESVLIQIKNNRSQKSTVHNSKSSRSHAIFRIQTQGRVLGVVDLAGSERIRQGCTHEQTTNINRSLLTLGRCITCMRESKHDRNVQIPFRESRLTMALAQYFAHGFRLTMVVNINPSRSMINETVNVLQYAAIARDIKPVNTPTKSRYRNINNSHNKMLVTLEETKSDGDFDLSFKKGTGSLLKRLGSNNKEVVATAREEQAQHLNQLREYIIKSNVSMLKNSYYEKHRLMNSEFNNYFEREMQHDQETDDLLVRSIKDSLTASVLKHKIERDHYRAPESGIIPGPELGPTEEVAQPKSSDKVLQQIPAERQAEDRQSVDYNAPSLTEAVNTHTIINQPILQPQDILESIVNKSLQRVNQSPVRIKVQYQTAMVIVVESQKTSELESNNRPIEPLLQSQTKERPGLFERMVVSPYHSIKKGVQKIWERISPAKNKKQDVRDASQLVLQKSGKLVSKRSTNKKDHQPANGKSQLRMIPLPPPANFTMTQNQQLASNRLPSSKGKESNLGYPDFSDYCFQPERF